MVVKRKPLIFQLARGLSDENKGRCFICRLCDRFDDIDKLVNVDKFDYNMSIRQVKKLIEERFREAGVKISDISIYNHYKNHLPLSLQVEFGKQKSGSTSKDNAVGSAFDSLALLKSMLADFNSKVIQFEKEYGKAMTPTNLKTFCSLTEEMRKLALDIKKIETDRSYLKKAIIDSFTSASEYFIIAIGEMIRSEIMSFSELTLEDKKKIINIFKLKIEDLIIKMVSRFDEEITKKL